MKILFVSPTNLGIGGTAKHVQGLTEFLQKNGHDVKTISSENTLTVPIKGLKNPSFMLSSLLKTRLFGKYDIIHAHHPIASLSFKASSAKKVVTFHGIYSKQIDILHGKISSNFSQKFEMKALEWADAITAGSKESYDYYTNKGYLVHYIPNAIDITSLPTNVEKKFEKQIIFVGRLSREKGLDTIIKLGRILPSTIHLLIVGTGPMENEIKKLTKNYNNIHYLGYLTKTQLIPIVRGSTVLIQPSLAEGISTTILEAMACKIPIIASDVGGNKELVHNDQNGFLIPPTSTDDLMDKILKICDSSSLEKKFGHKSFELVKNFDWSIIGKKYFELYEMILKN